MSRADGVRRWTALAVVAVVTAVAGLSAVPAGADPMRGDWFEYDYGWTLEDGTGDYEGYSETLRSHYRYTIESISGDVATVRLEGTWSYSDSVGNTDSGSSSLAFSFSVSTRRYIGPPDVEGDFADPAVWFWIPTSVAIDDPVRLLDETFLARSLSDLVRVGPEDRETARLEASGSNVRDDVYGRFDVTWSDVLRFDRETGYVLAESYEEVDASPSATFRLRADLQVTSASFVPGSIPPPPDLTGLWIALGVGLAAVVGIALAATVLRRGIGRVALSTPTGPVRVRIRRARKPGALDGLSPEASPAFGPLLTSFARRALITHDPVALATAGPRMVGLITYDGESALGSVFATDGAVARALLKRVRVQDFFAEQPSGTWGLPAQPVDSFSILEKRDLAPMPYDPQIVRPMVPEDIPFVIGIAQDVYRGRASRWVDTCFRDGDIAYVAVIGGRIVGFGFATVADHVGRLHTLTVLAAFRNRGIGTELTAARLTALAALGVQRVVVEISRHNAASLRVSTRAGFERIGETVYYSRVPTSSAMAFQRQF